MTNWHKIATVADFEKTDRKIFQHFTIFKDDDKFFACENRCPHMGYPMSKGTLRQGVITCAWHNWEFDTNSGGCYRGACEDLKIYPLKIEGDVLFYDKDSIERKSSDLTLRLHEAMRAADIYQQAKVLNQMIAHDVSVTAIIETALHHGYRHSIRNHQSETAIYESQAIIDTYLLSQYFAEKDKPPVLLQGIRMAGGSTGDRMQIKTLPVTSLEDSRSLELLEKYTKDFSPLGLERILLTISKNKPFASLSEKLLYLATQNYFVGSREILISISSLLRQSAVLPSKLLEEALIAQAAWVLGQTRQEPEIEERCAISWLEEHDDFFASSINMHASESLDVTHQLEEVLSASKIENIFDGLQSLLQKSTSELAILNSFSVLCARRFARLWLNNGGMWNSASEGIRFCYALRSVWHIQGKHQRKALFFLAFYYFQTRWLQNGVPYSAKKSETVDDPAKQFAEAFKLSLEPDAKKYAISIWENNHTDLNTFALGFCRPILEEDLEAVQINTLLAVLNEQIHQKEWQPYIAGMVTYCIDRKLQQNLKSAGKFGKGYFNEAENSEM